MTCTICGANLASTATVCGVCGATVGTPAAGTGGGPAGAETGAASAGATAGAHTGAGAHPGGGPPRGGPPPATLPGWYPPAPHPSGLSGEVRGWALGAHLAGLGLGLVSVTVLAFLGPLLVWLLKRDDHPFVDHHAKEALNFQLTVLLVIAAGALLTIPAALVSVVTLGLALIPIALIVLAAIVGWFVLPIVGAVKASNGEGHRYPFTIRFVR